MESHTPLINVPAIYIALPYLFLLIFVNWLGFRYKKNQVIKFPDLKPAGLGPTEGSLLGLMALLLSFSFGMSAAKFDNRRQLIVNEVNDLGTAILRCDLYPDSVRTLLRADFKNYLETRIAYYEVGDDQKKIQATLARADSVSMIIWKRVAAFSQKPNSLVMTAQMVPALNAVIDIVTTREASRVNVVPRLIIVVLALLTLISSFLAGYGSKGHERNTVMVFAFTIMTTLALYLVIELDRPRQGYINLKEVEQLMVNLRTMFSENR
jgi:hypothetical protein